MSTVTKTMIGRILATVLLLGGLALAGGREPSPVMPLGHAGMNHHTDAGAALMEGHMQAMLVPLRPLTGKAFDVAWVRAMIDHHQMAVDMAQHELMMGKDARVKAAAQKVVDAQKKEISTMQGWLKAWTGEHYQPGPMPMGMDGVGSMDRWFLEGMIPHHQGAIDMSHLIPSRTQNAALRQLGQQIIRVQSAEIAQYRQLLASVK